MTARDSCAAHFWALALATFITRGACLQFSVTSRHKERKVQKPHILFILADDLGFADVGYLRNKTVAGPSPEVQTPAIDTLVSSGVELTRMYAHKFCSPTRAAIQSGRAPIHVNVVNSPPESYNPNDPVGGFAGIPRNMTCIAELMSKAEYSTHFVGKWDAGMATPDHTPTGRGYHTSLNYWHNSVDYWQFTAGHCQDRDIMSLWEKPQACKEPYGHPASRLKNEKVCSDHNQHPGGQCDFLDSIFEAEVKTIIRLHDVTQPLFLFWAPHLVHSPMSVPEDTLHKFNFVVHRLRRKMKAMVSFLDSAIGRVVEELKWQGMYENTLIVFMSDNGGSLPAGNNYPLRGGKFSNFEGGIRVASFVSGGFVPHGVQGTSLDGLMGSWDWYATFARLAGIIDTHDAKAAAAGLPPHDSLDMWPMISGENQTSPRSVLPIGDNAVADLSNLGSRGTALVGGLIKPPFKLLLGNTPEELLGCSFFTGPESPIDGVVAMNYLDIVVNHTMHCGRTPETGCLFDIYKDPSEVHNLASRNKGVFYRMLDEINDLQKGIYDPDRGSQSLRACMAATESYNNTWGPFVN